MMTTKRSLTLLLLGAAGLAAVLLGPLERVYPQAQSALLVVDSTPLGAVDATLQTRLEGLGFTVAVRTAAALAAGDATGKTVVVVTPLSSPLSVGATLREVTVPVLAAEPLLFDALGMTGAQIGTDYGSTAGTQISITDGEHVMAAGLSGSVTVVSASSALGWGIPSGEAAFVASPAGDGSRAVIFGYETLADMVGIAAPARRVGFFLTDAAANNLTADGWELFDAATEWASGTASGATPTPTATPAPVVWTDLVGVTATGNSLAKTASSTWGNGGAASVQTLPSGDGGVTVTATEANRHRIFGLSTGNSNASWSDIDFGLYLNSNTTIQIYEAGTARGSFGTYAAGDTLRVAVENGAVIYRRNGTLLYTSTATLTYPLLVDAALHDQNGTLTNALLHGGWTAAPTPTPTPTATPTATPTPEPPTGSPVVWTNIIGVQATGNSLTKTASTGWANAGAASIQSLPSGDGGVSAVATEANRHRTFGLSRGDTVADWYDIDFGFYLNANGTIQIYEGGVSQGNFGTYAAGDVVRVAVSSGTVSYIHNGTTLRVSTAAPAYPLLVDTAFFDQNATLTGAVLDGNWTSGATPTPTATPTTTPPSPDPAPVIWTNVVGVTVSPGSLTKTAASGWGNAGAVSVYGISSGTGYVEFTASQTSTHRMIGLSNGDGGQGYADIDFALYLDAAGNVARAYEKGVAVALFGAYAVGDVFRVVVDGGTVTYWRNGLLLYTSAQAPVYPLIVDTALYTQPSTLTGVLLAGSNLVDVMGQPTPAPTVTPTPPGTAPELLVWTDVVGATATGSTLTATANGWGAAGAVSTRGIASGSGYFEFTATQVSTHRMVGLSNGNSNQGYQDIDHALYLDAAGNVVRIYEKGAQIGLFGTYVAGDVFRVAVANGTVTYWKNGAWLYASVQLAAYPLVVDASLYSTGATVAGPVLAGGDLVDVFVPLPALTARSVAWTNRVNATAGLGSVTKTGGAAASWDAGAASFHTIGAGEGYVEFTADPTKTLMAGLADGDVGVGYAAIDFAFHVNAGSATVWESGTSQAVTVALAAADVLRIEVRRLAGVPTVRYLKNGVLIHQSTKPVPYPLLLDASLYQSGAAVQNAFIAAEAFPPNQPPTASTGGPYYGHAGSAIAFSGAGSTDSDGYVSTWSWNFGDNTSGTGATSTHIYATTGSYTVSLIVTDHEGATSATATTTTTVAAPLVARPVQWTNLVNATASPGTVAKTSGMAAHWDAGASSVQQIASGEGYLEFRADPTKSLMLGLANGDGGVAYADIDYAFYVNANAAAIWESGVNKGNTVALTPTDTLRVEVKVLDGVPKVRYLKNGALIYQSTQSVVYPLVADASLYHLQATVQGAVIAAENLPANQPPTAAAGGPYAAGIGEAVAFAGGSSFDADGIVAAWSWDFGDGNTGTGMAPTHAYNATGTYTASLTVTDNEGGVSSPATASVQITPPPTPTPTATPTATLTATPTATPTVAARLVRRIVGSADRAFALSPSGEVWQWGRHYDEIEWTVTPEQVAGLQTAIDVQGSQQRTFALLANGEVRAWGENATGFLGDGTEETTEEPVPVVSLTDVAAISAGWEHVAALRADGTVWAWGSNESGQLGDGTQENRTVPTQVLGLPASGVKQIAASWLTTFVLTNDGQVYGWGDSTYGQLGFDDPEFSANPVLITGLPAIRSIHTGMSAAHVFALAEDGSLWAWGYNATGTLGIGTETVWEAPANVGLANVKDIFPGGDHSLALLQDGTVWAWGANWPGVLGDGTSSPGRSTPGQVADLPVIEEISAGWYQSFARSAADVVWVWGANGDAQLGDGTQEWSLSPERISEPALDWRLQRPTLSVSSGEPGQSIEVTTSTLVLGGAIHYTLNGEDPTPSDPAVISGGTILVDAAATLKARVWLGSRPSFVAAGDYVLQAPSPAFMTASGHYTAAFDLVVVPRLPTDVVYFTLDSSEPSSSSLLYSGPIPITSSTIIKAKTFRDGWTPSATAIAEYVISVPPPTYSPAPGTYDTPQDVSLVAPMGSDVVRYTLDGTDPTETSTEFTEPLHLTSYALVRARTFRPGVPASTVAIGEYAIGLASPAFSPPGGTFTDAPTVTISGPTGAALHYTTDGSQPTTASPLYEEPLTISATTLLRARAFRDGVESVTAADVYLLSGRETLLPVGTVAVGNVHTLVLRPNGDIWATGHSFAGQLGISDTTDHLVPIVVPGISGAVAIAAGDFHSLALVGGQVWTWGDNAFGQLGTGSAGGKRHTPMPVAGLSDVRSIAGGTGRSLALRTDGTVWAWGHNGASAVAAPQAVAGLANIISISAAGGSNLALRSDGSVWTWAYSTGAVSQVPGLESVTGIATGNAHFMALRSDGTVWTWGSRLTSIGPPTTLPERVDALTDAVQVSAGFYHRLVLRADGTLLSWGRNENGQLGIGRVGLEPNTGGEPLSVAFVGEAAFVAGGYHQSLIVAATGDVWGWGFNRHGQLGDSFFTDQQPRPVRMLPPGAVVSKVATPLITPGSGVLSGLEEASVSCATAGASIHYTTDGREPTLASPVLGAGATVTLDRSMTLKARGILQGWLDSDTASASYSVPLGTTSTPVLNPSPGTYTTAISVALTSTTPDATIRYTTDGTEPNMSSLVYEGPLILSSALTVKARAYGVDRFPSATATGLYTVSSDAVSTPSFTLAPGRYATRRAIQATCVTSGAVVRYTTDGTDPSEMSAELPPTGIPVARTTVVKVRGFKVGLTPSVVAVGAYQITGDVAAGQAFSLALASDGRVWAWGSNDRGQLGVGGTPASSATPILTAVADAVAIAAGDSHAVALDVNGAVWTWGLDDVGQLGDGGSGVNRNLPAVLSGLPPVTAVAAGARHSLALDNVGNVWAWGARAGGTMGADFVPVQVVGLAGIVAISGGGAYSLAVDREGALWAWGLNDVGQLGDGTTTTSLTPVPVTGLRPVTQASGGGRYALALRDDDTLWSWGDGSLGGLGDGAASSRQRPGTTGRTFLSVEAGADHALGIRGDGTLFAWGSNTYGQLGDGSTTGRLEPVLVAASGNVIAVAAGTEHTLALTAEGAVWSWGRQVSGQLGNGVSVFNSFRPLPGPVGTEGTGYLRLADNDWVLADADGDGLSSAAELWLGSDPFSSDTNGDGIDDGAAEGTGLPLVHTDPDGDGLASAAELAMGTDPQRTDTDGDGVADGIDIFPLDPARWEQPPPDAGDTTPPTILLRQPAGAVLVP